MWMWVAASLLQQCPTKKSGKIFPSFPLCISTQTKMFQLRGVLLELEVWILRSFLVRYYTFCWYSQTRSSFHFLCHRKAVSVTLRTNAARDELVQTRPSDLYWQEGAKPPLHICPRMKATVTSSYSCPLLQNIFNLQNPLPSFWSWSSILWLQSKTLNFLPAGKDQITESLCHFHSGLL